MRVEYIKAKKGEIDKDSKKLFSLMEKEKDLSDRIKKNKEIVSELESKQLL